MWKNYGFQREITGDGSPTLRLLSFLGGESMRPESMHHSGGALSETQFIYGPIVQMLFEASVSPRFLCVGLGLGYIEMLVALESLKKPDSKLDFLLSFESEESLKVLFLDWLTDKEIPPECRETYELAASLLLQGTEYDLQNLKEVLLEWKKNGKWVLEGPLENCSALAQKYDQFNGIFYDAFSRKTSEGLWSEEFLNLFLQQLAASDCLLATYASLGNLKRALKEQNFEVIVRPGFQGKRNSTWAQRGRCQKTNFAEDGQTF